MKVLVIDDSRAVHAFVRDCLKTTPLELTPAMNGRLGVEAVTAAGAAYDLILLDWEMPELNGPGTLDALAKVPHPPIVMMTTKNAPEEIAMVLEKGAVEYIMKPFTKDILLYKLGTVLNRSFE